jgi:hypothetical protein
MNRASLFVSKSRPLPSSAQCTQPASLGASLACRPRKPVISLSSGRRCYGSRGPAGCWCYCNRLVPGPVLVHPRGPLELLSFQPGGEPLGSAHGQPSRPAFGRGVACGGSRYPDGGGLALLQNLVVHLQLVVGERCVYP